MVYFDHLEVDSWNSGNHKPGCNLLVLGQSAEAWGVIKLEDKKLTAEKAVACVPATGEYLVLPRVSFVAMPGAAR